MKRMLALLLSICMLLSTSAAFAEEAAYAPGETTAALFAGTWNAGEIITADLGLGLDLDLSLLGVSGEEAEIAEAIFRLLKDATISLGAGRTENGVLLSLSGELTNEVGESVSVEASAEITADGLSVESDLIPGQKLTAKWETLLALGGMSDEQIAQFTAIKGMDFAAIAAQLEAQLPAMLESAAAIAAPYGETITAFLDALSFEQITDVPEQEDYPAVAALGRVTFTPKELAQLITLLADQLEQDATLAPLLDSLLAQTGSVSSTAELCAAAREFAASITDETPFILDIGVNESGEALYAEFYDAPATGSTGYIGLFAYPTGEPNTYAYWLGFSSYPDGQTIEDSFYAGMDLTLDPADRHVYDMTMEMGMTASGENILTAVADVTNKAIVTDENMPGYSSSMQMTESVNAEGDEVSMQVSSQNVWAKTAANGEAFAMQGTYDYRFPDMPVSMTVYGEGMFTPDGSSLDGDFRFGVQMPDLGVNAITISAAFGSEAYAPAQTTELAMETVTTEQMTTLTDTVTASLNTKLGELIAVLPADLLVLVINAAQ